jgi:hypothetical protein
LTKLGVNGGRTLAQATPKGLKACGTGQIILAISAAVSSLAYRFTLLSSPSTYDSDIILLPVGIVTSITFLIFAVAHTVSTTRLHRALGGYRVGVYGGIFGTVVGVTGLLFSVLAILGMTTTTIYNPSGNYTIPNILGVGLPIVYNASLTLTLILIGMFFIANRREFLGGELWSLTGAVYVLEGVSQLSFSSISLVSLYYYLPTSLILCGALGAICMLTGSSTQIEGGSTEVTRKGKDPPANPSVEGLGRHELSLGGLAQVLLAVSFGTTFVPFIASVLSGGSTHYYESAAPAGLMGSIILLISCVPLWISMKREARRITRGKNRAGDASVYLELIAAVAGTLYYGLTIIGVTIATDAFNTYSDLNALGFALLFAYLALMATFLVIIGAFFLINAAHSPRSDLWIAAGLTYMIIGSTQFFIYSATNMSYFATGIIIAALVGAACFYLGSRQE